MEDIFSALCYCQEPLVKWTCCCFETKNSVTSYNRNAAECTYKQVTGTTHFVCAACFEFSDQEEVDSKSEESSDADAFMLKKVKWTLDRISYTSTATMSSASYARRVI